MLVACVVLPIFAAVFCPRPERRFLPNIADRASEIVYAGSNPRHSKELGRHARGAAGGGTQTSQNVKTANSLGTPPLGFFEPPANTFLARLDPVTLGPTDSRVPIGEYHWSATVSPDGSRLAVATGGPGGGIRIVDVQRMRVIHSVRTGIAAEALAWLTPNRLLGGLQCHPANFSGRGCGVVLVDSDSGKIVRRWPDTEEDVQFLPFQPPLSPPKLVARTRHGVVFLLSHWREIAPARLVLINDREEFRSVSLPPIRIGFDRISLQYTRPFGAAASGGLAVDGAGERAFVIGAAPTVAEVDLTTMTVRYHEVQGLERRGDRSLRGVLWLDGGRIAVFGEDVIVPAGDVRPTRVPAGVTVIDTMTWRAQTIDARASTAAFAAGTLIVYGGDSPGLTGYASDGRERFRLFYNEQKQESIVSVHLDGEYAYVVTSQAQEQRERSRVRVVNVAAGTVMRDEMPAARLVDLIR